MFGDFNTLLTTESRENQLICMSEFFKKLKWSLGVCNFGVLKNLQLVQINSKLNEENRMILTYSQYKPEKSRGESAGRPFLKRFFLIPHKIFVIILRYVIAFKNFLLSFSQS